MPRISLLPLFILLASSTLQGDCKCAHPVQGETTHWGGNEAVVEVEDAPLKQLQGIVKAEDGSPVSNALVEVFTHPEYLLSNLPNAWHDHPEQQRVGACLTSKDGKFCFRHLPAAAYELRSSVSSGWDVTHVHVTVDPQKGKAKKIVVPMQIGK
jgi:hypothetical protein